MTKFYLLLSFFLLGFVGVSQDTTFTIYFKSGQSSLNTRQLSLIKKINSKPIKKIICEGYADTVGRELPNQRLSLKRAQTVASFFQVVDKSVKGFGEVKDKKIPLNKMRRVVVKVWFDKTPVIPIVKEVVITEKPLKPEVKKVVDPCTDDTTIISSSGSRTVVNRCFYNKCRAKGCFSYEEYLTANTVEEANLETIAEDGDELLSGGMINIQFCDGDSSNSCLKKPIIIYLPVPPCLSSEQMTLWVKGQSNRWRDTRRKIEIVTIADRQYYKMEIFCPGFYNCDVRKKRKRCSPDMKIKLKDGLRFKSATMASDCPLYNVRGRVKKHRKKVAKFPYTCPASEPIITIDAYDKKTGQHYFITTKELNNYKQKRRLFSKCKCDDKPKQKYLGIFNIRQKRLYKKYKIYLKDFPQ